MSELVRPDARWFFAQLQANRRDDEDGCSYWTGELRAGYPWHSIGTLRFSVHRVVAAIWWGPEAVRDKHVHHLCEHPSCINPRHLVPLTTSEHTLVHAGSLTVAGRDAPAGPIENLGACLDVAKWRPGKGGRPTRAMRMAREQTRRLVLIGLLANAKICRPSLEATP